MSSLRDYFTGKQLAAATQPELGEGRLFDLLPVVDRGTLEKITSNKFDTLSEEMLLQFQKCLIDIYVIAFRDKDNAATPSLRDKNKLIVEDIKRVTDLIKEGLLKRVLVAKEHSLLTAFPSIGYHGSPYSSMKNLDPEMGEGIGTWFYPQESASGTRNFVHRNYRFDLTKTEEPNPTVYKAEVHSSRTVVFENEGEMRHLGLPDLFNASGQLFEPFERSEIRQVLLQHGFDSILLKNQNPETFCILDARNISIIEEIDTTAKEICEKAPSFLRPEYKRPALFEP